MQSKEIFTIDEGGSAERIDKFSQKSRFISTGTLNNRFLFTLQITRPKEANKKLYI